MTDYFLKFDSEDALQTALLLSGITDDKATVKQDYSLDIIGAIWRQVGNEVDTEGRPVMTQLDCYHANLRGELTQDQLSILLPIAYPNNPARVWLC